MTLNSVRAAEITSLSESLGQAGKVRVPLSHLWTLWAAAAPRLVGDPDQATCLASALTELAERGLVELPRSAWDNSTTPPLPRSIIVPGARQEIRKRHWVRFPWCSELGWVASLPSLSDARFDDLITINNWLVRNRDQEAPVVPLRCRSVLIFGDEKHLETMARTSLFGPGRPSFELLACVRLPPPLAAAVVGSGPDILVTENSDTYWTAVEVLRSCTTHPVGAVAWGAGRAFPTQVPTLSVDVAGRGPVRGVVWYWGDLDPDGLTIAAHAAAATTTATPQIRPATALWAAMAERPIQNHGTIDWTAAPGRDWLGPELWIRLAAVRSAGGRVAQESVPASVIEDWAKTIPRPMNTRDPGIR